MKKDTLPKGYTMTATGLYRKQIMSNGERYVFSGRNLAELKAEVEKKQYEIKNGLYEKEKRETVDRFFETWLNDYKVDIKRGTASTYRQTYKNFICGAFGKCQLKDVKGDHIQKHINKLVNAGYSYSRINLAVIILNGIFSTARKLHYINNNPMECVTMPSKTALASRRGETEKKIKAMTAQEKDLFLKYADGSKYLPFYVFALNSGCRIGEALALKWSDVDFAKKQFTINGTLEYIRGTGRVIEKPKTKGSRRTIPMTAKAYDLLLSVRKKQMANRTALGKLWKEEKGLENLVFTYEEGGGFWDTAIRVDINNIISAIRADGHEIIDVTPHTFRHTFATLGLKAGIQPKAMQSILGHSTFAITMDIYCDVLQETKNEAMDVIASVM